MVLVLILSALSIVLCIFVDRLLHKRSWDLLAKIPGPTPWPIIGNAIQSGVIGKSSLNPITRFFQNREGQNIIYLKDKMNVMWIGRAAIVFLCAPETVEPVISSNTAIEKGLFYRFMKPWLGDGLVMSTGDKWHKHRKLLTPSFHFRILDNFMVVMNEQSEVLVKKVKEASQKADWLDTFTFYSKCTLEIIAETAMGIRMGVQDRDSKYTQMVHRVSFDITLRSSKPWLASDFVYFRTKAGREFREAVDYLHSVADKVISEKMDLAKKNPASTSNNGPETEDSQMMGKKRLAFLDLILDSGLSKQEIREQTDTFIFAGHDTTATALTWMTYMLGLHEDVQDKLLEEIDSIFGEDKGRPVTKDDLKDLKYMEIVMKECQRVYPSVPGVSRTLDKDTLIGGYTVPKGTQCFISIYSVHRDPNYYPNPEIFDPDRFLPENSHGRHPYAFIPFSAGPRNCIGQRFALMEQKIIMCHILRHFRILSLDPRDKLLLVPELVLRTDSPIRIKFIQRS